MADYMSIDHLRFLLYQVHDIESILSLEYFADYDRSSIDILIDSVKDYSDKELFPYFKEMDDKGAYFEDGKVHVHPQIGKIMKDSGANGWLGTTFDYEGGGMQMPHTVANSLFHIMESANNHVPGYLGLTSGSANLIRTFGTKELYNTYGPKMLAGEWGGTMCLTEPQAGSSLSDINTLATANEDGSYNIKGHKIFISGGDHEYCENFIHLTIARIDGAPAGTKGISLFVVPKKRIKEDGSLENNDVETAGDFQKLGQKGYCTTHLVFGENDDSKGWLVGEANKGLKYMFMMMNGARIDVGLTAASTATAAYYASLQYAKERPQGRLVSDTGKKDATAEQTLIINHPDVRRMLLLQKAITEGSISLLLECSKYADIAHAAKEEEKNNALLLLELLVPIAKTYPSEKGQESISNGLQVLGGYGYTSEFILQQYYRDIRIMSLYEGTTGIQSIDLLGRKIPMANGKALQLLLAKATSVIKEASAHSELKSEANQLADALGEMGKVLQHLSPIADQGKINTYLSDATIFMKMMGNVVIAYQWLKMGVAAAKALKADTRDYNDKFYQGKIITMKFYYKYELPLIAGDVKTLMDDQRITMQDDILSALS